MVFFFFIDFFEKLFQTYPTNIILSTDTYTTKILAKSTLYLYIIKYVMIFLFFFII